MYSAGGVPYFAGGFRRQAGVLTLLFAAFTLAAGSIAASTVTLAWDRNAEPDIAGYKVYLGNSSRNYTSVVDAANNTTQTFSNLVTGTTYYFAVTAYNTNGLESDFSSELSHTVLNPTINTAPVISAISDTNMPANGSLTVSFTVNDAETSADSLILTATSSNPDLLPESNIVLGGNGVTRTVTLDPEVDQNGTATITIIVSDGSVSASESFTLDVSVPPTALVAAYSFDAFSGTSLADLAGTNTGVISGAVWAAAGRFGGALAFDGINDVVTVADAARLDLTTGMTIEAWVYSTAPNAGVWRSILVKERTGGGVYNLHADTDTSVPAVSTIRRNGSFNEVRGTNPVPANTWTHLAATYDGKIVRLFVNGIEVSSEPMRGPLLGSTGPLRIGGNSIRGEYFQGMIDEVRIYNRPLSPAEIEADMQTPVGRPLSFLGNTADGSLADAMGASWINASRYQAAADLSVSAVVAKVGAISGRYKCAIYTDNSAQPGQLLQSSVEIASPSTGWQSFPLSSTVALTNGQYYWLAIWSDHPDSRIFYSGTDGTLRWGNYNYGAWPNPLATGGGANVNYCIYAVDTVATLLEAPPVSDVPTMTEVPFVMDMITPGDSPLVQLTWESIPGAIYRVLGRIDLNSSKWENISADILAEGSLTSWVDSNALATMYSYRVIQVQ